MPPGKVYTADEVRALERAIIAGGVPGIALMKRAGRATLRELRRRWPEAGGITIFCGTGNNGGDGYVVARLALEAGLKTQVVQVGDAAKLRGDAATARRWAMSGGVAAAADASSVGIEGEVIVDALLGTGARGAARPACAAAMAAINESPKPVLAIDLPSGLSADTGDAPGAVVKADATVTFIGEKLGLRTGAGVDCCGDIVFDSLGAMEDAYLAVAGVPVLAPPPPLQRPRSAHKNRFGHVLVVGGDRGMGGAVLLAGEAALRTGAGLVSILTRPEHCGAALARQPELMARGAEDGDAFDDLLDACTVIAVGPGLGRGAWGKGLLRQAMAAGKPLVIDADGLNLVAANGLEPPRNSVMTPHPGEAARLLGLPGIEDRPAAAKALSQRYRNVVVLKGAGTLVAEDGALRGICTAGNPGLATAGAGDVLTGVVAALLALGFPLADAAAAGVCLHAMAGDAAQERAAPRSLVATDVINALWAGA